MHNRVLAGQRWRFRTLDINSYHIYFSNLFLSIFVVKTWKTKDVGMDRYLTHFYVWDLITCLFIWLKATPTFYSHFRSYLSFSGTQEHLAAGCECFWHCSDHDRLLCTCALHYSWKSQTQPLDGAKASILCADLFHSIQHVISSVMWVVNCSGIFGASILFSTCIFYFKYVRTTSTSPSRMLLFFLVTFADQKSCMAVCNNSVQVVAKVRWRGKHLLQCSLIEPYYAVIG